MAKLWESFHFFLKKMEMSSWTMVGFVVKKMGMSLLAIGGFVAGIFCWALAIYPFNLPYLLHLPSDETDFVISSICGLLFVCIVTITVRTKWCYEEDLFFSKEDKRFISLVGRIVKSREFITDVAVFAVYVLGIAIAVGLSADVPWYSILTGTATMLVGGSLLFGIIDCILYAIARRKADKRLNRRKEEE